MEGRASWMASMWCWPTRDHALGRPLVLFLNVLRCCAVDGFHTWIAASSFEQVTTTSSQPSIFLSC
jgi:hypothetical protein